MISEKTKSSWWWKLLTVIRVLWTKGAEAGYLPDKGQGGAGLGDGGLGKPAGVR